MLFAAEPIELLQLPRLTLIVSPDDASRALKASALHVSTEVGGPEHEMSPLQVSSALETLYARYLERRAREIRSQIAEAQRRGDTPMLMQLMQAKLELERECASQGISGMGSEAR